MQRIQKRFQCKFLKEKIESGGKYEMYNCFQNQKTMTAKVIDLYKKEKKLSWLYESIERVNGMTLIWLNVPRF